MSIKIKKLIKNIINLLNFSSLLISSVLLLFIYLSALFNKKYKQKKIIFAGLEHVIDKSAVRGEWFEKKGFKPFFYSFNKTGKTCSPSYKPEIIPINKIYVIDLIKFLILIIKHNPSYIEIYFEGNGLRQIFYSICAKMNKSVCISILRGELYYYYTTLSYLKKFAIQTTLKISDYSFYRETYMKDILNGMKISNKKLYFDSNKIKVYSDVKYDRKQKIVLFLNGMKKWRRANLIIKSIPLVLKEIRDVKFIFVGARNEEEKEVLKKEAEILGVLPFIEIHPWTNETKSFYEKASVFVLPADLIFCNFSLLEAMERGVPAIVSDVKDADKIITHGVNGYLSDQNEKELSKYIISLLKNEDLRLKLGMEARKTILKDFNDIDRMQPILEIIMKRNLIKES